MTDVRFLLDFDTDPESDDFTFVDGSTILSDPDRYVDLLATRDMTFQTGAIDITANRITTRVEDTLKYLVLGLCFQAVPPLIRSEEYTYRYFDGGASDLHLVPSGDDVYISGRHVHPLVCQRVPLARALVECGTAYLRFLDIIDQRHDVDRQVLDVAEAKARAAVEGSA